MRCLKRNTKLAICFGQLAIGAIVAFSSFFYIQISYYEYGTVPASFIFSLPLIGFTIGMFAPVAAFFLPSDDSLELTGEANKS